MSPLASRSRGHPSQSRRQPLLFARASPARLSWAPPEIQLEPARLPPLPAVQDADLSRQARTSKNYLFNLHRPDPAYRVYDAEINSYRPLEWLGDSYLHSSLSLCLLARYPELSSNGLTIFRARFTANSTFSHLALAYGLDRTLLTAPVGEQDGPLNENQNVVADMFEAHIGALVREGATSAVDEWCAQFLNAVSVTVDEEVKLWLEEARVKVRKPHAMRNKRTRDRVVLEEKANGLASPAEPPRPQLISCTRPFSEDEPARSVIVWEDMEDESGRRHSHLEGIVVGCGRGRKQVVAREGAYSSFVVNLAENDKIAQIFLSRRARLPALSAEGSACPASPAPAPTSPRACSPRDLKSADAQENAHSLH